MLRCWKLETSCPSPTRLANWHNSSANVSTPRRSKIEFYRKLGPAGDGILWKPASRFVLEARGIRTGGPEVCPTRPGAGRMVNNFPFPPVRGGVESQAMNVRINMLFVTAMLGCLVTAGGADKLNPQKVMNLQITSSAFSEGQPIPAKYSCEGSDISPPLQWIPQGGTPANTKSFALIMADPDAPVGTWVH